MLNVCLEGDEERAMGISHHVCEVQLVLAAFRELLEVCPDRVLLAAQGTHIL